MSSRPSGWLDASLAEVCTPVSQVDPVIAGRQEIRYVDIGSVDGGTQRLTGVPAISALSAPTRARQVLQSGDTLFSTVRPYLRKIAYVDDSLDNQFASTGFTVLRPGPYLLPRYLFHFATSHNLLSQVLPHQRGVSYPAVRNKDVFASRIPVPPLVEQRRIVEILEALLSRLDAADRGLVQAKNRMRHLRAAHLEQAKRSAGPEQVALADVSTDAGYGTSAKCVPNGAGPAVVRIPNLRSGEVDLSDEKRLADPAINVSGLKLAEGDFLVVRTNGSRDLIGRAAVVQPGVNAAFASYLIRFRLDPRRVRPRWARLIFEAPSTRATLEELAASSAGQYNLGLKTLAALHIPVPELEIQDDLLASFQAVSDVAERLERSVQEARAREKNLRRSLLQSAFRDDLPKSVPGV